MPAAISSNDEEAEDDNEPQMEQGALSISIAPLVHSPTKIGTIFLLKLKEHGSRKQNMHDVAAA